MLERHRIPARRRSSLPLVHRCLCENLERRTLLAGGPIALVDGISDVTSEVTIVTSGAPTLDPTTIHSDPEGVQTPEFKQVVTVENTSSVAIPEPMTLVATNLPSGVTLDEGVLAASTTNGVTFDGGPFVPLTDLSGTSLAPGGSLTVVLEYINPQAVPITDSFKVLSTNPSETGSLQYAINGAPVVVNDVNALDFGITAGTKTLTLTNIGRKRLTVPTTIGGIGGDSGDIQEIITFQNPSSNLAVIESDAGAFVFAAAGSTSSDIVSLVLKPGKSASVDVGIGVTGAVGLTGGGVGGGGFPVTGVEPGGAGIEEQVSTAVGNQSIVIKGDISPTPTVNFGSVATGSALDRTFTITAENIFAGGEPLTLSPNAQNQFVQATGSFSVVTQPTRTTLSVRHPSTTFTVQLLSTRAGTRMGTISFASNAVPENDNGGEVITEPITWQCLASGTITKGRQPATATEGPDAAASLSALLPSLVPLSDGSLIPVSVPLAAPWAEAPADSRPW